MTKETLLKEFVARFYRTWQREIEKDKYDHMYDYTNISCALTVSAQMCGYNLSALTADEIERGNCILAFVCKDDECILVVNVVYDKNNGLSPGDPRRYGVYTRPEETE